jgi:hypothetical protein
MACAVPGDDAADDPAVDERFARRYAVDSDSGSDGLLEEHRIEVATADGQAALIARVPPFDRDAAFAGDDHPVDGQRSLLDGGGQAEPPKHSKRARIDCVAAQLVAGKDRAIDQPDAHAGSCKHERGNGARGAGSNDQDIIHGKPVELLEISDFRFQIGGT